MQTTVARSEEFPPDLLPQPCWRCGAWVVYAVRCPVAEHGTLPVAIELAPTVDGFYPSVDGVAPIPFYGIHAGVLGCVAIQTSLIICGPSAPCAYETQLLTRYRWHGPHCMLPGTTGPNPRLRWLGQHPVADVARPRRKGKQTSHGGGELEATKGSQLPIPGVAS